MEKEQKKLIEKVLKRFEGKGILKSIILIGSWCVPLYKKYFKELKNLSPIRTRDMDFLVPLGAKFKNKVDIAELLKGLGFKTKFYGHEGYIKLIHASLILEFLVPERGRGSDKPYDLPELGINAQRLRLLDLLVEETVKVEFGEINVILPHPVNFALHKLIISSRRSGPNKKEKGEKDRMIALQILNFMLKAGEVAPIKGIFKSLNNRRQKEIITILEKEAEYPLLDILKIFNKNG